VPAEELPGPLAICSLKTSLDGTASPRSGRLASKPNLKSVKSILKKFFAGFQRITETEISDELRNDVYVVSIF
jgi:hypothetical protein